MTKVKTPDEFFSEFTAPSKEKVETPVEQQAEEKEEIVEDPIEEELDEENLNPEEDEETDDAEDTLEDGSEEESEEEEEAEDQAGDDDEDVELLEFAEDEEEDNSELSVESIASELGFEGVSTKKELIEKYKEGLEKAKDSALEGVPENLKEAVIFAKEGGDFMAMLDATSIDYDKVSNRELVEASVHKYFVDEEGNVDREAMEDWFENEGKARINMLADQIRSEQKRDQQSKIQAIKEKAAKERETLNAKLKSELEKIDSIGGVKISQAQKDAMYRDTVSGQAMEELFYEDGKISNKKVAENLFKVRMFEKAIHIAKTSAKNDGKREVIKRATNADVKRKSEKPKAEIKKVSPMDQFFEMVKNRK